jgi:regulator of sigma E protease
LVTFIAAIIVFSALVIIHEFGHFLFAKLSGIKVEEFAVGMGPKILSTKKGETVFSIRAFPLGGFCKMLGEDQKNSDPRAFNSKPVYKRIAVIAFGPIMNLILTILIFSIVVIQVPMVNEVLPGKPAEASGIIKGDKIIAIDGNVIKQMEEVNSFISQKAGNTVNITIDRNGDKKELTMAPIYNEDANKYIIGISMQPELEVERYSIGEGMKTTADALKQMYSFLAGLVTRKATAEEVVGPVGIIDLIGKSAKLGMIYVLNLTAVISLNLFVINLLPLPALDGGRLVFLALEGIRRKPVDAEKEGLVHFVGFVLLMLLAVFIMFKDLIKLNILNF